MLACRALLLHSVMGELAANPGNIMPVRIAVLTAPATSQSHLCCSETNSLSLPVLPRPPTLFHRIWLGKLLSVVYMGTMLMLGTIGVLSALAAEEAEVVVEETVGAL
mmetsp:Transcript_42937/g.92074  ORF Transcript_42937/g.92074 Transcript_42937/m.92074 type:complete len:107 (-) Transcript_42937:183-503(-)